MYLGIDVGGTKTLLAAFDEGGALKTEKKFATPENYEDWLVSFRQNFSDLSLADFEYGVVAIPGEVERSQGVGIRYGNLSWQNNPIQKDVEEVAKCSVLVENDAKIAGLYEAKFIGDMYKSILYITIGTGVGVAYIVNGKNDLRVPDLGGAVMTTEYDGQTRTFDSFASGKAIKSKYGKLARDISDQPTWQEIVQTFTIVFTQILKEFPADLVIIGGGVGSHYDSFGELLNNELRKQLNDNAPVLMQAKHSEEAVIYGCYELAKNHHASAN